MKKTNEYREEIRAMFAEKLEKADFMQGFKMFDATTPKYGVPVQHPELGTVYVSLQLVVKGWTKTASRDAFDLDFENEVYQQEMDIKNRQKAEKEAEKTKKKAAAIEAKQKRDAAKAAKVAKLAEQAKTEGEGE